MRLYFYINEIKNNRNIKKLFLKKGAVSMNITFMGRKVTPRESFKERAEKKLLKLDKFFDSDAEASVTATHQKDLFTVEITIKSKGMYFRAEKTLDDMQDAFEDSYDAILKQILKNKTKLSKKFKTTEYDFGLLKEEVSDEPEFNIVREKSFTLNAMSKEEAILQMNMLGHTFFLFIDSDTEKISVVYKRRDKNYGLLEPEY